MKVKQLIFSLLFSIVAIWYTIKDISFQDFTKSFQNVEVIYLFLTALITWSEYLVRAMRWKLLLSPIKKLSFFETLSPLLIGSLGNLFDRIYYSAVPDFIDISYKGYHWFIFNVADIFISIGIICLIFVELMNYKKSDEN